MNSILIILKINMVTTQGLLFTDTDSLIMKLKLKISLKILATITKYLTLVIILTYKIS